MKAAAITRKILQRAANTSETKSAYFLIHYLNQWYVYRPYFQNTMLYLVFVRVLKFLFKNMKQAWGCS